MFHRHLTMAIPQSSAAISQSDNHELVNASPHAVSNPKTAVPHDDYAYTEVPALSGKTLTSCCQMPLGPSTFKEANTQHEYYSRMKNLPSCIGTSEEISAQSANHVYTEVFPQFINSPPHTSQTPCDIILAIFS